MKKFIYKSKKTGKKVQSDKPIVNTDLILVAQVRDGSMKSGKGVIQKKS